MIVRMVQSITQSTTDAARWCLKLACGHECWIRRANMPTYHAYRCTRCSKVPVQ